MPTFRRSLPTTAKIRDVRLRAFAAPPDPRETAEIAARREEIRSQGARDERARLVPLVAALERGSLDLARSTERAEERAESRMLELVKAIALEVLRRDVEEGRYDLPRIVGECLAIARGVDRGVTVLLHPDDHETLRGSGGADTMVKESPTLRFRSDPAVARGGCVLETPYGTVARDLETAIADVLAAVDGRR